MKTNVYIDGFNFYYGAVRGTAYKWLDFSKLCPKLLQAKHRIHRIKYFPALVKPVPSNPDAPLRQQIYLRALTTIPNLTIIRGHFLTNECSMPLAHPPPTGPQTVRVVKTEEKGSDVNLACHLLLDAFNKDCEAALVISNDSDLLEPIRMARSLGVLVGVVCPHVRPSHVLKQEADFFRKVKPGALRHSQFPPTLTDGVGTFTKPAAW